MYARNNTRAAGLRFQRLHGMVKFTLVHKPSHGQKSGNKMGNWVIDLSLH